LKRHRSENVRLRNSNEHQVSGVLSVVGETSWF